MKLNIEQKIDDWAQDVLNDLMNQDEWQEFVKAAIQADQNLELVEDQGVMSDAQYTAYENSAEYRLWWEVNTALVTKVLATAITKSRFFFRIAPQKIEEHP